MTTQRLTLALGLCYFSDFFNDGGSGGVGEKVGVF